MNYLAHIYLSGIDSDIKTGGFIADFVKGNKEGMLPKMIWNGIKLHRLIDSYTDSHPIVKELNLLLKPEFGRYSPIILDMYFDHLLAKNFRQITGKSLWLFSIRFSITILAHYRYLPEKVKRFIFHFTGTNRLYKYSKISGLKESLQIMSVYKIKTLNPEACIDFFDLNKHVLEKKFNVFFNELQQFTRTQLINLSYN